MTLEEAIIHSEEVAEEQEKAAKEWHENQVRKCKLIRGTEMDYTHENECKKCAEEHRQLAEWLRDYKRLKEQDPKIRYCRNCRWWKDSDGAYRRGVGAESKCPMNRKEVYEGTGYCYMFELKEGEVRK